MKTEEEMIAFKSGYEDAMSIVQEVYEGSKKIHNG